MPTREFRPADAGTRRPHAADRIRSRCQRRRPAEQPRGLGQDAARPARAVRARPCPRGTPPGSSGRSTTRPTGSTSTTRSGTVAAPTSCIRWWPTTRVRCSSDSATRSNGLRLGLRAPGLPFVTEPYAGAEAPALQPLVLETFDCSRNVARGLQPPRQSCDFRVARGLQPSRSAHFAASTPLTDVSLLADHPRAMHPV